MMDRFCLGLAAIAFVVEAEVWRLCARVVHAWGDSLDRRLVSIERRADALDS